MGVITRLSNTKDWKDTEKYLQNKTIYLTMQQWFLQHQETP